MRFISLSLRPNLVLGAFVLMFLIMPDTRALDNGVGLVPPMGWSSWNSLVDLALHEATVREMADALLAHGLDRLGYRYVNVDCGWSHVNRTSDGQIQADPLRFPTGMAALGRYLHQRGLLFGLYTARGKRECCGRTGYDGAEDAQRDANMFAMWGVDYLKLDSCGKNPDAHETEWQQYAYMRDAVAATGRPMYLSICEIWVDSMAPPDACRPGAVVYSPMPWLKQGLPVGELGNGILVEYGNNANSWETIVCMMRAQALLTYDNLTRPGIWNDNDMLTVGCSDHVVDLAYTPCKIKGAWLNAVEVCFVLPFDPDGELMPHDRTQFTYWVITASPLILGNDLRYMSPATLETISNPEVIAINQDPLGHRGIAVFHSDPTDARGVTVFAKRLSGTGRRAVAVFNLSEKPIRIRVQWDWLFFGEGPWTHAKVRDLWRRAAVGGSVEGGMTVAVAPHASQIYLVHFGDALTER